MNRTLKILTLAAAFLVGMAATSESNAAFVDGTLFSPVEFTTGVLSSSTATIVGVTGTVSNVVIKFTVTATAKNENKWRNMSATLTGGGITDFQIITLNSFAAVGALSPDVYNLTFSDGGTALGGVVITDG